MANTSYLRYTVEPWVCSQLEARFGRPFASQILPLSPGGGHEFDAVSDDGKVVVAIKTSTGLTSGGKRPAGKIAACLNDIYFLTLVDAPTRILMLTNPEFHDLFTRITKGQIPSDIWVESLELPPEMQLEVNAVTRRASDEMNQKTAVSLLASSADSEVAGGLAAHTAAMGGFWTYENDVHRYARVHKADCSHCNDGRGSHNATHSNVGRWIDCFEKLDNAMKASNYPTNPCSHCLPSV